MNPSLPVLDEAHAVRCELAGEVLRSSGTLRLRVMGWSMLPAVWPGDTLIVDRLKSNPVAEGDIVLFGRDRRLFAHRVIRKSAAPGEAKVLTRGDALPQCDPPVSDHELLGKVSFILRNGKCIEPSKKSRLAERAVAALVRHSEVAARVVVGLYSKRQASRSQVSRQQI